MRTIHKYKLPRGGLNYIDMPEEAEVLCVQTQRDEPYLWALVDPKVLTTRRLFEVFATGEGVTEETGGSRQYIGTFQVHGGSLVFHVFEYTGD